MRTNKKDICESQKHRKRARAVDPSVREQQLISLAVDEAERKLMAGTASDRVIIHYLNLATGKEKLEREKLECEIELLKAKKSEIESASKIEEMYSQAIEAMTRYGRSINSGE